MQSPAPTPTAAAAASWHLARRAARLEPSLIREILELTEQPGVAYVPGSPFYCGAARVNTLRLSFVTVAPPRIEQGVATLGRVLAERLAKARAETKADGPPSAGQVRS